jgi:hypothetical protein
MRRVDYLAHGSVKTWLRGPALVAAALGLGLGGCNSRLYDTGSTISLVDGGPGMGGAAGTGTGGATGAGGMTGAGGAAGGATGAAGMTGMGGAGGVPGTCDPNSPDRQTDLANCGTCFNLCNAPNATAQCVAGACQYTCISGYIDADHNSANGCECTPTNGGVEICDGIDNNCDGVIDEGFDLMSDLDNCGGCNVPCYFPFATSACSMGVCQMVACLPDFYDRDPTIPGCETSCQKTNNGVEICDGLDNDCNGLIDGMDPGMQAATITCKNKGVCAGTSPVCMGPAGFTCTYPSTYQDTEDTTLGCDGLDNDCDGLTDEPFGIGKACSIGKGACTSSGTWICDNTQTGNRRCNAPVKQPGVEVCDGIDNDCDGTIDELDKLSDDNDSLVTFTAGGSPVTMFVYEASRYDATGASNGFDSSRRPCSLPSKLPWSNITKEEAATACGKVGTGWSLCSDTQWQAACEGMTATVFPYGATYVKTKCNGNDYGGLAVLATGAATSCVSQIIAGTTGKLFDMSGNVKEWVSTPPDATICKTAPCFQLRGGAYDTPSFVDSSSGTAVTIAPGLQCDNSTPAPASAVRLPSVGFRCCYSGGLPQ